MVDLIIIVILAVILSAAVGCIVKARKKGQKCIGCPYCSECAKMKSGNGCDR